MPQLNARFCKILLSITAVALVVGVAVVARHGVFFAETIVIEFDGTQFNPSFAELTPGTTVTFKNVSGQPFWPASDLHPSHGLNPEFDPRAPIKSGASWSFVFPDVGDWSFHDHLLPTATGVIRVVADSGVGSAECVAEQCWEQQLVHTMKTVGLPTALTEFVNLYQTEPAFKAVCHDVMHSLGKEAYHLFIQGDGFTLNNDTSYCGYGFYHGFMETLLVTTGDMQSAREFCTYVDEQLIAFGKAAGKACYHGIGHGFTDGSDPRTWGDAAKVVETALQLCTEVALTDEEKYLCGTGVYNGLSLARIDGLYGLNLDEEHVFAPCETVRDTQFRLACYEQMNTSVLKVSRFDISRYVAVLEQARGSDFFAQTLRSSFSAFVSELPTLNRIESVSKVCIEAFPNHDGDCILGAVSGIIEFGAPGNQHLEALQYCDTSHLTPAQAQLCYGFVNGFANDSLGPAATEAVCIASEKRFGTTIGRCEAVLAI